MKNTLMYVLIAVALLALAYKFAYPKAPNADMIAKVGDTAKNMASGAVDLAGDAAKKAWEEAKKVADTVNSGVNAVASGAEAVVNNVVDTTIWGSYTAVTGSVVKWLGKKVWGSHPGQITLSEGSVTVKDGKVQGGKLVIDMKTIKTLDDAGAKLDGHLSGPDFFDVAQFPIAEFAITSVENGIIVGDLTMKGVTKEISFPGTVTVNGDIVTAKAKTNIERALWNVKGMEAVIDKYFEIEFDVSFKK